MILLKTTALLIGLGTQASVSIDHTTIPSMIECKHYLTIEEKRLRTTGQDVKIQLLDNKLNTEFELAGHKVMTSFECIDINPW